MLYKWLKALFSRVVIITALILVQVGLLVFAVWKLSDYFVYWYISCVLLSLAVVIWLMSKNDNPSYKLAWTILILVLPIFGGLFYLIFGIKRLPLNFKMSMKRVTEDQKRLLQQNLNVYQEISGDKGIKKQVHYFNQFAGFPIYKNTTTEYLTPGEMKFERMVEELKKAKHYIFMEYFIIEEGTMWDTVLDILRKKVQEGVEVRVMYDDIGCINTLPNRYDAKLRKMGIQCCVFNPFHAKLNAVFNNRDHRKILVIDGYIAFTGGINLADEYINAYPKHGHWKDASIMVKGDAVWSFTIMFLTAWNLTTGETCDYEEYRSHKYHPEDFESDGYVIPYADSPFDGEHVGEYVYMNIINNATDYVYINTPYLIVDHEFLTGLSLAAKNGVDVRIVTPHIPDKWYVHLLTQSFYPPLVRAGVKIYEYTPGFIHSKTFVSDDHTATVGTINLDFRSLYLHFECGTWLYQTKTVAAVKEDFLKTLERCQEITLEDCKNVKWYKRCLRGLLRVFAPLM